MMYSKYFWKGRLALQMGGGWVRVERTGSKRPLPSASLPHVHYTWPTSCPTWPLAKCTQLHWTAITHLSDKIWHAVFEFCTTDAESGREMQKRCGWTLQRVGGEPFLGGPPPADLQLSAGAARVPSETFWRTTTLNHGKWSDLDLRSEGFPIIMSRFGSFFTVFGI